MMKFKWDDWKALLIYAAVFYVVSVMLSGRWI